MNDKFKIPFSDDESWLGAEIEKTIEETDFYSDLDSIDLEFGDWDD